MLAIDDTLHLAVDILANQLHREIVASINNLAVSISEPKLRSLANRVDRFSSNIEKATAMLKFLTETIESSGVKDISDNRDTLLFMREHIETSYQVIVENNNQIFNAFGDNHKLERLCVLTYYEFYRIHSLASLEGLRQLDLSAESDNKLKTQEAIEVSAETGKHEKEKQLPKQDSLALSDENNQNIAVMDKTSFYETADNLRQKVFFYLVSKHRRLDQPNHITRAQLARNIIAVTGDNERSIIDVLKNKLRAKKYSATSAKQLSADLLAVYNELKNSNDEKGKQIVKNEIKFLAEDVENIKNN